MRREQERRGGILAAALLLAGCGDTRMGVAPPRPPAIDAAVVTPNDYNVLSAVVSVRVHHADSVAVRFHPADMPLAGDSATPSVPALGDAATVPVLGLLPAQAYVLRPVVYGPGGTVLGAALAHTTGPLPADLPGYVAGGADPSPGYVVFAAGLYGVVIDNTGRVVWYRAFPQGPGLNFQAQPNGRYAARPPGTAGVWMELDALGNETRTLGCARGVPARFHDLLAARDGSYWIMCDDTRTMDLTQAGGVVDAQVTGTVIHHIGANGALLFEWSPFDHFAITDLDVADRSGASVNWTHGNALDVDGEGNLVVSFRSLNEVTKIDTRTGAVVWRMGGLRNQITFVDAPSPAFARQHGLRVVGPSELSLLDNMGDAAGSHAERYVVDDVQRTARLVASYGSDPAVIARLGGTTQPLPGDRTLVSFGNGDRVEEYDAQGRVVWRIDGDPGYVFRAQRISSLYRPGLGDPR
jgi:Arylsulfotransferase (ASST)